MGCRLRPVRAFIGCLLTAAIAGCQSGGPVAVVNRSDEDVIVRFERREAWTVPAGTTGVGPIAVGTGSLVELFDSDCQSIALWGIHGATTIVVEESVTVVPTFRPTPNRFSEPNNASVWTPKVQRRGYGIARES